MKIVIPALLAIVGLLGGAAGGHFLKPHEEVKKEGHAEAGADKHGTEHEETHEAEAKDAAKHDFARLNKQFVVPIVKEAEISSLVIMSLTLEVDLGATDMVFAVEPKLRDVFLQALFLHAQSGGFDGVFTSGEAMKDLRAGLKSAAKKVLGAPLHDVLVTEIIRQDL